MTPCATGSSRSGCRGTGRPQILTIRHGPAAGLRARFLTELELAPLLHHPAIAEVYDGGEAGLGKATLPFEVVEYVDGESAGDALGRDGTSLAGRAEEITDGVLQALEHCHGYQIAHGRVIPGQRHAGRDGQVKLINFGVAAVLSVPGCHPDHNDMHRAPRSPLEVDSPTWPPSILRGASADHRSDLYSVGCLLYALLTGAPPYYRRHRTERLSSTPWRTPPQAPSQVAGDSAAWADAVVSRALATDPDDRYQSATEMRAALGQATGAHRAPPHRKNACPSAGPVRRVSGRRRLPTATSPPPIDAPPQPEPGPDVGARLAGYRLEERIGRGGMASVFLAIDERLGRQAAVKVLAPSLAADESFRQRFIRESRAAAAVDHPNILPVYEAGEADGVLYIAMRYVSGGDVLTRVRQSGPLPPDRAVDIVAAVASALDVAHASGPGAPRRQARATSCSTRAGSRASRSMSTSPTSA